jgi:hypothetical protein
MGANRVELIEANVERVAGGAFAAAVGYAVFALSGLPQPEGGIAVAVAGAISFYFCRGALAAFAERQEFAVPSFEVRAVEFDDDELVLTDADRLDSSTSELLLTEQVAPNELLLTDSDRIATEIEPLELDDILAELGPDSRVVRLFDRKAMPTPGQLKSSFDSHLGRRAPGPVQSDAAQALSEALAELRRSLR